MDGTGGAPAGPRDGSGPDPRTVTEATPAAYRCDVSSAAIPSDPHAEPGHAVSTTLVLSLAAVAAALIAIFGSDDSFTSVTVGAALVGLVPWALVAGGLRVPVPVFAAIALGCAAVIVVVDGNEGGMFPVMLMVVWVCRATGDWPIHAAVLTIGVGLLVSTTIRENSAHEAGLVYFTGGLGISWLAGMMLRRQETLTVELRAMNELQVEHAATAERARIARDVHDVVAHSLTVVMLHLTGARRAIRTEPARAEEALARAETVGRESLDSIRQVMGVLRDHAGDRATPSPGLAEVRTLLDGYRIGGLGIEATIDDPLHDRAVGADPSVGVVVYRVIQESLTNVLRHAPGASCQVTIRLSDPHSIAVAIGNRPAAPDDVGRQAVGSDHLPRNGGGLGIRGMIERVRAIGGDLVAGPGVDGGWQVTATIPRRAPGTQFAPTVLADDGLGKGVPHGHDEPEAAWPQPIAP